MEKSRGNGKRKQGWSSLEEIPQQKLLARACFFCYKSVIHHHDGDGGGGGELLGRLGIPRRLVFTLLERYLGCGNGSSNFMGIYGHPTGRRPTMIREEMLASFCQDCLIIVGQFGDLYNQLKSLELRINWKVWKLRNVMSSADRIKSRRDNFREALSVLVRDLDLETEHAHELKYYFDQVKHFRKELLTKSSRKLLHFPRVSLKRCSLPPHGYPHPPPVSPVELAEQRHPPNQLDDDDDDDEAIDEDSSEEYTSLPPPEEPPASNPSMTSIRVIVKSSSSVVLEDVDTILPLATSVEDCNTEDAAPQFSKLLLSESAICDDSWVEFENEGGSLSAEASSPHGTDSATIGNIIIGNSNNSLEASEREELLEEIQSNNNNGPSSILTPPGPTSTENQGVQLEVATTHTHSQSLHLAGESEEDLAKELVPGLGNNENPPEPDLLLYPMPESFNFRVIVETLMVSDKDVSDEVQLAEEDISKVVVVTPPVEPNNNIPSSSILSRQSLGLRARHACSNCKMTFSTQEKLEVHAKKTHSIIVLLGGRRSDSASEEDEPEEAAAVPVPESDDTDFFSDQEEEASSTDYESLPDSTGDDDEVVSKPVLKKSENTSRPSQRKPQPVKTPKYSSSRVPKLLADGASSSSSSSSSYYRKWFELSSPQHFCQVERCKESFYLKEELENHSTLHGSFPCQFCACVKTYAPELAWHEAQQHAPEELNNANELQNGGATTKAEYKCSRCPYSVRFRSLFIKHFLGKHLSLKMMGSMCPICRHELPGNERRVVQAHVMRNHDTEGMDPDEEIQKCDQCPAYFRTLLQLEGHKGKLHPQKFTCSLCPRWFPSRRRLRDHKLSAHHLDQKDFPFQCSQPGCNAGFETLVELHRHLRDPKMAHNNNNKSSPSKSPSGVIKPKPKRRRRRDSYLFSCEQCQKRYTSMKALKIHQEVHRLANGEPVPQPSRGNIFKSSYPCSFCGVKYKYVHNLRQHLQKFHSGLPSKKIISQTNNNTGGDPQSSSSTVPGENIMEACRVEIEKEEVEVEPTIECPVSGCILTFTHAAELEVHSKRHGDFKCAFCDIGFTYAPDLALHELQHSKKNKGFNSKKKNNDNQCQHHCARCDYTVQVKSVYSYVTHHLNKHLNISCAVPCPLCLRPTKAHLSKHMRAAHYISDLDPRDVSRCDQCPAYFRTSIQLASHKTLMHSTIPLKVFKCQDCGKEFSERVRLRSHRMNKHVRESDLKFACDAEGCGKRYETKIDLDFHHNCVHSKKGVAEVVECPTCGKKLSQHGMNTHMRMHDPNWKPKKPQKRTPSFVVCEQCGVNFKDKHRLAAHLLSHSGPSSWKYSCPICGKKCSNKPSLEAHLRTHTQEKPFICQVCGECYAHRHNLRNHVNSKHSDVMEDKAIPKKRRKLFSKKGIPYKPLFDKDKIQ